MSRSHRGGKKFYNKRNNKDRLNEKPTSSQSECSAIDFKEGYKIYRRRERDMIASEQWRYFHNKALVIFSTFINDCRITLLPEEPTTTRFYEMFNCILQSVYGKPIKDPQYYDREDVYWSIRNTIEAFVKYEAGPEKGFFGKIWDWMLAHVSKRDDMFNTLVSDLLDLYDETVELYKDRDFYYIDIDGNVAFGDFSASKNIYETFRKKISSSVIPNPGRFSQDEKDVMFDY